MTETEVSRQSILAYPILITKKKEAILIDIPDFSIQIEEQNKDIGEAMVIARYLIISKIDELIESGQPIPEAGSSDYKKNKNMIFSYIDVNMKVVTRKNKSLEELEGIDAARVYSMWDVFENCIEFLRGQKVMMVTFSQARFANKIKKLSSKYPDEVKIISQNKDGSVYVKMPVSYLHIYRPNSGSKKEYTEEDRKAFRERITKNLGGSKNE